jgi:hypothetical protein
MYTQNILSRCFGQAFCKIVHLFPEDQYLDWRRSELLKRFGKMQQFIRDRSDLSLEVLGYDYDRSG